METGRVKRARLTVKKFWLYFFAQALRNLGAIACISVVQSRYNRGTIVCISAVQSRCNRVHKCGTIAVQENSLDSVTLHKRVASIMQISRMI